MPYAKLPSLVFVVAIAACTRNVPASTPPPLGASQKLELARSGHLLVSASAEGRPYRFVLDTGANITSVSSQTARELGIVQTGSMRINNAIDAPTGTVRVLEIAGVEHADVPIAIVDIPDALATGADGILGLDVFARHDFVVDLAGEEFGVYPAGTLARSGRELVNIEHGANGLILMDITLDERTTMPGMLDLGAPVSVLNRPAGAAIGAHAPITHIAARTGDTDLVPVRAIVQDLGTFARLGLAHRPAIVLGTDVFEDRVLAISYRDRVAFVSR